MHTSICSLSFCYVDCDNLIQSFDAFAVIFLNLASRPFVSGCMYACILVCASVCDTILALLRLTEK